ncbi:MAG: hypothetical protein WCE49_04670, partial [Terrimicrobiaceae bacterium]
ALHSSSEKFFIRGNYVFADLNPHSRVQSRTSASFLRISTFVRSKAKTGTRHKVFEEGRPIVRNGIRYQGPLIISSKTKETTLK